MNLSEKQWQEATRGLTAIGDPPEALLRAAEALFGSPKEAIMRQEVLPWELDLIESVCGDHRYHDLTAFVLGAGGNLALVRKPSDPPGAYWTPAGGMDPGEELAEAVCREVWEETGLQVEVMRYLFRLRVLFTCQERSRPWTSHVFLVRHESGEPAPVDCREVEEAAWISLSVFQEEIAPVLKDSGWGRFRYRLRMATLVFEEITAPDSPWWPVGV